MKLYTDTVQYDVVGMDACHVLLKRSWMFDVKATYKAWENTCEFPWGQGVIVLLPIKREGKPKKNSIRGDAIRDKEC